MIWQEILKGKRKKEKGRESKPKIKGGGKGEKQRTEGGISRVSGLQVFQLRDNRVHSCRKKKRKKMREGEKGGGTRPPRFIDRVALES